MRTITTFTKEENKKLCDEMPYLIPRNVFTDEIPENYNYEYIIGDGSLPEGWRNLFLQMCYDIKEPLEKAGYLNKFRFSQIKEKYAQMRAYNFGAPQEVLDIIADYEYVSRFICMKCGKLADYKEAEGNWMEQYCHDCAQTFPHFMESARNISINKLRRYKIYGDGYSKESVRDISYILEKLYGKSF